jgi:hypothetical protein
VVIDQPLTQDEQAELRAISARALITPTSFVNHYAPCRTGVSDRW